MRMILDLSNLDESRWVQLTGNSGHAFHSNYDDQFELVAHRPEPPMRWNVDTIKSKPPTLSLTPMTRCPSPILEKCA